MFCWHSRALAFSLGSPFSSGHGARDRHSMAFWTQLFLVRNSPNLFHQGKVSANSCWNPHSVSGLWIGIAIVMAGKWSHLLKDGIIPVFMDLLIILLLLLLFLLQRCLPFSLPPWMFLIHAMKGRSIPVTSPAGWRRVWRGFPKWFTPRQSAHCWPSCSWTQTWCLCVSLPCLTHRASLQPKTLRNKAQNR